MCLICPPPPLALAVFRPCYSAGAVCEIALMKHDLFLKFETNAMGAVVEIVRPFS